MKPSRKNKQNEKLEVVVQPTAQRSNTKGKKNEKKGLAKQEKQEQAKISERLKHIEQSMKKEEVKIVEKKLLPEDYAYGPSLALDHRQSVRESIQSLYVVNVSTNWCSAIAQAIVSYAVSSSSAENLPENINSAYVYKYLAEVLNDYASNATPAYELDAAPAVFWDIMYAIRSKKTSGRTAFTCVGQGVGVVPNDPSTANTANSAFGSDTGTATGYQILVTSGGSYTSVLGLQHTKMLFTILGKKLDVVAKGDYPDPFGENEASIYAAFTSMPVSNLLGKFTTNGASTDFCGSATSFHRITCEWLARLGLTNMSASFVSSALNPNSVGRYSVPVYCTPAAMVIFRMMMGYRGRDKHRAYPMIKSINMTDILTAWDTLINQVIANYGLTSTAIPAIKAGLGPIDFKICAIAAVATYFNRWQCIATGMSLGTPGSEHYLNCGTLAIYNTPSFAAPAVLMENLAKLFPYKQRKQCIIFPCLYVPSDFTVSVTANYATTNNTFTAAYNMITNLVGATEVCVADMTSVSSGLQSVWDVYVSLIGPYVAYSMPLDESKVNLTAVTKYAASAGGSIRFMTSNNLPDHILPLTASNFVPFVAYLQQAEKALYMQMYQEYDLDNMSSSWSQLAQAGNAWTQAIHVVGGFGNSLGDLGQVEDDVQEEQPKSSAKSDSDRLAALLEAEMARREKERVDRTPAVEYEDYSDDQIEVRGSKDVKSSSPAQRQSAKMHKTTPGERLEAAVFGGRRMHA